MLVFDTGPRNVLVLIKRVPSGPLMFLLCCYLFLQLAFCTGEHQVAAAPVPAAEGGPAGGQRCGPRPQARPGALL